MDSYQVAAAAIAIAIISKRRRKKRSTWTKRWISRREELGYHYSLLNEWRVEDPMQYRNFLRFDTTQIEELTMWIGPAVSKQDTVMRKAIPVQEKLVVTLRFLASGDSYTTLSSQFRIAKSTICKFIPEVCAALGNTLEEMKFLKPPSTEEEWNSVTMMFESKWNFPRCIGALDGKHITIQAPANSGSFFYNYKGFHSIVLMALVSADYKFLAVNIGCNGRTSDSGVFASSGLPTFIEKEVQKLGAHHLPGQNIAIPHVIVADEAFPLRHYLLKPFSKSNANMDIGSRVFNYRLSRARRVVENTFGIIANKFRVLRQPLLLEPQRMDQVVRAICCLHNYLITKKPKKYNYASDSLTDKENTVTGEVQHGSWRELGMPNNNMLPFGSVGSHNASFRAQEIRYCFKDYFVTPMGELNFQYNYV